MSLHVDYLTVYRHSVPNCESPTQPLQDICVVPFPTSWREDGLFNSPSGIEDIKTLQRAPSAVHPSYSVINIKEKKKNRKIKRFPSCLSFISSILKINVVLNPRHATVEYLIQHMFALESLPSSGARISDPRPMSPCSWMTAGPLAMVRRWNTLCVHG